MVEPPSNEWLASIWYTLFYYNRMYGWCIKINLHVCYMSRGVRFFEWFVLGHCLRKIKKWLIVPEGRVVSLLIKFAWLIFPEWRIEKKQGLTNTWHTTVTKNELKFNDLIIVVYKEKV